MEDKDGNRSHSRGCSGQGRRQHDLIHSSPWTGEVGDNISVVWMAKLVPGDGGNTATRSPTSALAFQRL